MIIETFTIDQLCVSPLNVRKKHKPVDALAADILERGLLFPLIVHPSVTVPPEDWLQGKVGGEHAAPWAALAGGRRCRAIRQLVDAGDLPRDYQIPAVKRDLTHAQIVEMSLAENLQRDDLLDYEIDLAIAHAHDHGATSEDIAKHFGKEIIWVRRHLRLGNLDPELFAAYAAEELSIDQARAYAAVEDQALQRAAYAHFRGSLHWQHSAANIRAWMKVGDREMARLLTFAGVDVYRAAGGRFELDLFADGQDERGRVVDEGLLREQVENKLGFLRAALRVRTGRGDLRFAAEPPRHHGQTDSALEFTPRSRKGKPKQGDTEETRLVLPGDDVVATIEIREDGEPEIRWWWASRKARRDAERGAAPAGKETESGEDGDDAPLRLPQLRPVPEGGAFDRYGSHEQNARAAVKDEHGFTADGLQVVRSTRRQLLRALIVKDAFDGGQLGRDYLVWSQLRQALAHDRWQKTGARGLISEDFGGADDREPRDMVAPYLEACAATARWESVVTDIRQQDWMTTEDPAEAFAAYARDYEAVKDLAGAVLAGLAMVRSANAPGWRVAAHDRLAQLAGGGDTGQLREYWAPTADFVGLLPRMKRLELAQPFVDPDDFRAWPKAKDGELTRKAAAALTDECWVHPLLTFPAHPEEPRSGVSKGAEPQKVAAE